MAYNYWCSVSENGCELCNKKGNVQLSEKADYRCPNDPEHSLKLMGETVSGFMGTKMTPQQVQSERKARSTANFKSEILPTLGRDEQRHFAQKYKKDNK